MKAHVIISIFAAAAASLIMTAEAQEVCPELESLAAAAVPAEVGDFDVMRKLLEPPPSTAQLPEVFSNRKLRRKALKAVGAKRLKRDPKSCCHDDGSYGAAGDHGSGGEDCQYRSPSTGEVLRLDLDRGKVTYLNPGREFNAASGRENKVSDSKAESAMLAAAVAFGVPEAEMADVRVTRLKAASVPIVDGEPALAKAKVLTAEVFVLTDREIGETPVFASELRSAIDVDGEVARMHVRWPRFCVPSGLQEELSSRLMKREEVVRSLARTLAEQNPCRSLDHVSAEINYVAVGSGFDVGPGDDGDEEPGSSRFENAECFAPALVVHAIPVEAAEDSGDVSTAAVEYIVPLLRSARDSASSPLPSVAETPQPGETWARVTTTSSVE